MGLHYLQWQQALPGEVPDAKVYSVLEHGRELLRRLSGGARDIQFRHKVEDREATIGGPLGQKINVRYITLVARFDAPDFALPAETQGLMQQHRMTVQHREVIEAANKAIADHRKELEARAKAEVAQRPESIRELPGAETAPAHTVALDKMLISPEELARVAYTPDSVSVFDGGVIPTDVDKIH